MAFDVITMSGSLAGGTVNAIAQIDIPQDGRIEGVQWAIIAEMDADLEDLRVLLSFGATGAVANDTRSLISMVTFRISILTAVGAVINGFNLFVPLDLDVSGGERIFLHEISSAGVTGEARALLHFRTGGSSTRAARRRQ